MLEISVTERVLHFKRPARTSRGEYTLHRMLLVRLSDGIRSGTGECAPLPDLSADRAEYPDTDTAEALVAKAIGNCTEPEEILANAATVLRRLPALLFAVESAVCELYRLPSLYDSSFARSEVGIPINGLVWMGDYSQMLSGMQEKVTDGYRCIKLKIGAIDWEDEISLLRLLRSNFTESELQIRVDANGAFSPSKAMARLEELSRYRVHSIEQPIKAGQWESMARLCVESPVPVALDEELIGIHEPEAMAGMLDAVRPAYIVVKPSLHGGMAGTREWIRLASERGIGSWITSALESNVGLKKVALLCASIYEVTAENVGNLLAQGLGTGLLYTDNIDTGVVIRNGSVWISE